MQVYLNDGCNKPTVLPVNTTQDFYDIANLLGMGGMIINENAIVDLYTTNNELFMAVLKMINKHVHVYLASTPEQRAYISLSNSRDIVTKILNTGDTDILASLVQTLDTPVLVKCCGYSDMSCSTLQKLVSLEPKLLEFPQLPKYLKQLDTLEWFLTSGGAYTDQILFTGYSPQRLKMILDHCDINILSARTKNGDNILHHLFRHESPDCINYFLEIFPDTFEKLINEKNSRGRTPVAYYNHCVIALDHGYNPFNIDADGNTFLHLLFDSGRIEMDTIEYLVSQDYFSKLVNTQNLLGMTALHYTENLSSKGFQEVIEICIKNGYNVNTLDMFGNTFLGVAPKLLDLILDHKK